MERSGEPTTSRPTDPALPTGLAAKDQEGPEVSLVFPPPREGDAGAPGPGHDDGPRCPRGTAGQRSPWAVGVLTFTAIVLVGAMLVHLAMLFLSVAPPNALSKQYRDRINTYVQPEFSQNWQLFAPNPAQLNQAVGARVRTQGADGTVHTSDWINITAKDIEAIKGNPAPSHAHQNMLRRAWEAYTDSHNYKEQTNGPLGRVAAAYLKRVVLQRLGTERHGEPIVGLQIAGRITLVPPPAWTEEDDPDSTTYRILPWSRVTERDHEGL
ncbi:hypothetical protein AQ490_07715 [Wenjunlia vitaminophila]|uniref:Uncharacterized protein n=1 Tax=Wenjunlia vitaminophila TaxID=76728 RepID=A0A0T6LMM9_WENVI|nr:DUF5819 family protein [Wenjunlia vitaminophila]KRV47342.1 hypothetical protein AQ490_07715 [Wenjunlia vitaminophila]